MVGYPVYSGPETVSPFLKFSLLLIPVTAAVMTVAAVFSVSLDCDGIGCGAGKQIEHFIGNEPCVDNLSPQIVVGC